MMIFFFKRKSHSFLYIPTPSEKSPCDEIMVAKSVSSRERWRNANDSPRAWWEYRLGWHRRAKHSEKQERKYCIENERSLFHND